MQGVLWTRYLYLENGKKLVYHHKEQTAPTMLAINWSLNNVICDNAIKSDGRNNRKSCATSKAPLDVTMNTSHQPPMLVGGHSFTLGSFINKNEHIWIRCFCSNAVHVNCVHLFILFCSRRGNNFLGDGKPLECSKKSREYTYNA